MRGAPSDELLEAGDRELAQTVGGERAPASCCACRSARAPRPTVVGAGAAVAPGVEAALVPAWPVLLRRGRLAGAALAWNRLGRADESGRPRAAGRCGSPAEPRLCAEVRAPVAQGSTAGAASWCRVRAPGRSGDRGRSCGCLLTMVPACGTISRASSGHWISLRRSARSTSAYLFQAGRIPTE
jgi:hypothetical protein